MTDWSAVSGPYFDDLVVGQVFDSAPSMTLSPGVAAAHQAILGDRLRLALDAELTHAVTGVQGLLAHPALVCDIAIGQSTLATQRVKANLFYRGVRFHRFPVIGDTLFTRTAVVGLRQNSPRPDRSPTGLVALRMTTVDQIGRLVLDFHRCAMLPLSPQAADRGHDTGHADDLSGIGTERGPVADPTLHWSADGFRRLVPGPHFDPGLAGAVRRSTADVASSAPELARLTLNIAATHHDYRAGSAGHDHRAGGAGHDHRAGGAGHDHRAGGARLVYGGHTIGLALAQATRLLPNLATVLSWQSCDHTGPVAEGDTLYSDLHIERADPLPGDRGGVLTLRSQVYAVGEDGPDRPVLDWRFTALLF